MHIISKSTFNTKHAQLSILGHYNVSECLMQTNFLSCNHLDVVCANETIQMLANRGENLINLVFVTINIEVSVSCLFLCTIYISFNTKCSVHCPFLDMDTSDLVTFVCIIKNNKYIYHQQ